MTYMYISDTLLDILEVTAMFLLDPFKTAS